MLPVLVTLLTMIMDRALVRPVLPAALPAPQQVLVIARAALVLISLRPLLGPSPVSAALCIYARRVVPQTHALGVSLMPL